jgi:hypothetical protein
MNFAELSLFFLLSKQVGAASMMISRYSMRLQITVSDIDDDTLNKFAERVRVASAGPPWYLSSITAVNVALFLHLSNFSNDKRDAKQSREQNVSFVSNCAMLCHSKNYSLND